MMLPDKQSKTMVSRFSAAVIEQRFSIAERANPLPSTQPESWGQWTRKKSICQCEPIKKRRHPCLLKAGSDGCSDSFPSASEKLA